ncbi:hypothetical protein QUB68_04940 [Microcoleus sp. A006_D1]|uniref:hypothetical protein n=1 Tax=Microcoleus sp. A006_D1 TaxID=3055267 RepID=UPI002FD3FEC7
MNADFSPNDRTIKQNRIVISLLKSGSQGKHACSVNRHPALAGASIKREVFLTSIAPISENRERQVMTRRRSVVHIDILTARSVR